MEILFGCKVYSIDIENSKLISLIDYGCINLTLDFEKDLNIFELYIFIRIIPKLIFLNLNKTF